MPEPDAAEVDLLRHLFDETDTDKGGTLDRQEVGRMAVGMGSEISEHELDAAMVEMDADGSGEVDFEELKNWYFSQKTGSKLQALLEKKIPRNNVACERELLSLLQSARQDQLKHVGFVALAGASGWEGERHRRRAVLVAGALGSHAHPLQPVGFAYRSQHELGESWTAALNANTRGRMLQLLVRMGPDSLLFLPSVSGLVCCSDLTFVLLVALQRPICESESSDCICCVYDRVLSRRYKDEGGMPGLHLRWCLCHERTQRARKTADADGDAHILRMFSDIDADGSGGK